MTRVISTCTFLVLLNIILIFAFPASKATLNQYHLTDFEYRVILFATSIPSFLVWYVAFIGYAKLIEYAKLINKTREGIHFYKLALGCVWLAWSMPVTKTVNTIFFGIDNIWPTFHTTSIIISNYIGLLMPLIAFSLIATGAQGMINQAKLLLTASSTKVIMLLYVIAGVSFCYFTFKHLDLSSVNSTDNSFYLPIWLLILSVIIPYLYAWFIGLLAAWELSIIALKAHGHLYKRGLWLVIGGLVVIIGASIAMEYLNSIQPRVGYLLLNFKLVLTLTFRIIQGVGFGLIAVGATRLKKIEEV
ncbi:MAG: hypothetical protein ACXWLH_00105 [Candidatus Saccharimonadales bacterium]